MDMASFNWNANSNTASLVVNGVDIVTTLANKADAETTMTIADTLFLLNGKANTASPTFTGTVNAASVTLTGDMNVSGSGKKIIARTIEAPSATNLELSGIVNVGQYLNAPSASISNSLIVSGVNVGTTLSGKASNFNVVAPLRRDLNVLNNTLELSIDPSADMTVNNLTVTGSLTAGIINYSPFWVAGKIDGTTNPPTVVTRKGDYSTEITCVKKAGQALGVYDVRWTTPHPDGANWIGFVQGEGSSYSETIGAGTAGYTNISTGFTAIFRKLYSQPAGAIEALVDCPFSFYVFK